ncbi:MAG: response regulator [candidate division Zixibacteria bacterium]
MKKKKIILADDSLLMRGILSDEVRKKGLIPIQAENGAEVLVKLRDHGADVVMIVLDWNMPVMDGYEALQKVRVKKEFNHIPILMATADGDERDVLKAIKAGASGYLVKPFSPKEFSDQIVKCIGETELEDLRATSRGIPYSE